MSDNQLKCPNCEQYKIYSLQYRVNPKTNQRISMTGGVVSKGQNSLLVFLGLIGSVMFICVGLVETSLWAYPTFLITVFAFVLATGAGFYLNQQYLSFPKEFDHYCQVCGYKWTTSDKVPSYTLTSSKSTHTKKARSASTKKAIKSSATAKTTSIKTKPSKSTKSKGTTKKKRVVS